MRIIKYILPILLFLAACNPTHNGDEPQPDSGMSAYDSIYYSADIQHHGNYYPGLDCEVFSIDLLSDGLAFDSSYHIHGSGLNLYLSDIFLPDGVSTLQDGIYHMDTTAQPFTFLPYMHFEGNVTGCYLLDIKEDNIQTIIGFTAGEMTVTTVGEEMVLDFVLYVDSTSRYHATYHGQALYR